MEFLRFGRTFHGRRFTGSHSLSQKTSGSFGAVKKAADTKLSLNVLKFAGNDGAILISLCVSVSLRFRFPTLLSGLTLRGLT